MGTKLLKVAFSNIFFWRNVGPGYPSVNGYRGLTKEDIVTWTGARASWREASVLQVLHPHQGLIWVQETYLDSF